MIYEAIENPILQKFLKIDVNFDPNYEYAPIAFDKPNTKLIRGGDALDIEGFNMFRDLPIEQVVEELPETMQLDETPI